MIVTENTHGRIYDPVVRYYLVELRQMIAGKVLGVRSRELKRLEDFLAPYRIEQWLEALQSGRFEIEASMKDHLRGKPVGKMSYVGQESLQEEVAGYLTESLNIWLNDQDDDLPEITVSIHNNTVWVNFK